MSGTNECGFRVDVLVKRRPESDELTEISRYKSGLRIRLVLRDAFDGQDDSGRVEAQGFRELQQFDHVNATLAALDACNEGLSNADRGSQLRLRPPRHLALADQEIDKCLVPCSADRLFQVCLPLISTNGRLDRPACRLSEKRITSGAPSP